MSMNEFLSAYYGDGNQSLEQDAQMEFFAKTAAQNGIDLSQLSGDQINYLWDATFNKTAEEDEAPGEPSVEEILENLSDEEKAELLEELEKEEAAEAAAGELEQAKESMAKIAEADYLGRVMAHSYVDELQKTAGPREWYNAAKGKLGRYGELLTGKNVKGNVADLLKQKGLESTLKNRHAMRKAIAEGAMGDMAKSELKKVRLAQGITGGALGAAGLGGAGAGYALSKESSASAINRLAAEEAVIKAAEAGWDPQEAAILVSRVVDSDPGATVKLASADSLEEGIGIRSLEMLEAAGYPVNW